MRAAYITVFFLLAGGVSAEVPPHAASVKFRGASTLHDFEGTGASAPFQITLAHSASSGVARITADASLQVSLLTTDHTSRDKNMMKMFEQPAFPIIQGRLHAAPVETGKMARVALELQMHGKTNVVEADISDFVQLDDNKVSFHMAFDVKLDAFGMQPPSVLGLIRVDNRVKVDCQVQPFIPPR